MLVSKWEKIYKIVKHPTTIYFVLMIFKYSDYIFYQRLLWTKQLSELKNYMNLESVGSLVKLL